MKKKDQRTIRSQTFDKHAHWKNLNPSLEGEEFLAQEEHNWGDMLTLARNRPTMFIGNRLEAHVLALGGAIRYLTTTLPFLGPLSIHITCAPTQYIVRCTAGPLLEVIEHAVDWNEDRMLIDLLQDPYFNRTQGVTCQYGIHAVYLSKRFFVGIASQLGFRYQTYQNGWPTTDVLLSKDATSYSFVIAAQLTSEWFTGLPFKQNELQATINEYRSIKVTWEMRVSDTILPDNMAELCS